jgi:hypothetical protein
MPKLLSGWGPGLGCVAITAITTAKAKKRDDSMPILNLRADCFLGFWEDKMVIRFSASFKACFSMIDVVV